MAHHVHEAIFSLDRVARCALKASDTLPSLSEDNAHAARLSEAPGEAHYEVRDEKGDETSGVARGVARGVAPGGAAGGMAPGGTAGDVAGGRAGSELFLVDRVLLEQLELVVQEGGGLSGVRKIQIDPSRPSKG